MKITHIALVGAVALSAGCAEETLTRTYSFDEPIAHLAVDTDSAGIVVVPAAGPKSYVELDVTYWSDAPDYEVRLDGSTLRVVMDCHWGCDGGFVIRIPASATASVDSSSGDIEISERDGDVEVWSSSGDIDLVAVSGAAWAEAASGDIRGVGLQSPSFYATAASGDIEARFETRAEVIDLETASGDIELEVPAGGYELSIASDSGRERVRGVYDDGASAASIRAHAASGDVSVRGF